MDRLLAKLSQTNNIAIIEKSNALKTLILSKKKNKPKFISFGDMPYVQGKKAKEVMKDLLNSINKEDASLIINVGDIMDNYTPSTNSSINIQVDLMNSLNAPVLYTPGDNEWLDCKNDIKDEDYNFDRLAYIRETFFSNNKTLGINSYPTEN